MIAKGIEGIWQTAKSAVGLALGLVVWSGAWAQAELVVNTPQLSEATAMMEDRSEKEGRDMVGILLPAQADFFELADRAVSGDHEVWTLTLRAEGAVGPLGQFGLHGAPCLARQMPHAIALQGDGR